MALHLSFALGSLRAELFDAATLMNYLLLLSLNAAAIELGVPKKGS